MSAEQQQRIIMTYTVPPSTEDLEVMAGDMLEQMPDELMPYIDNLVIVIEDMPDDTVLDENDIDGPFDLMALFKSGKEISPGIESKTTDQDDTLTLYRRPVLDFWCESGDDLGFVLRQVMVEEIGRVYEFSDSDIEEMIERHYPGML